MTGRERVKAALEFSHPDRAPRNLWALPYVGLFRKEELEAVLKRFPGDFGGPALSATPAEDAAQTRAMKQGGSYTDEWGSVWQVAEPGVVGEVKQPALADWSALEHFQPPWDLVRKRDFSYANRQCESSDLYMLSPCNVRPFERLQFLRGTENLYLDLAYGARQIRTLIDMLHEFYLAEVTQWSQSGVDAVCMMDDWGSSRALLISPAMWRAIFKPLYAEYCRIIRGAGKRVFFHSDGFIEEIYGDLIEIGVDALNSQLFCMNIEGLARQYKGRVTFWGEIDRQKVLPFGTPEEVREAVRRVRRLLDDGTGGVIAQCEWGKDNPQCNIEAVFDAWM